MLISRRAAPDVNREPDSPPSGLQSCGADCGPAVCVCPSPTSQCCNTELLLAGEQRESKVNVVCLLCRCFLLSGVCFITHSWCLSVCARSRASLTVACAHEGV